MIRTITVEREYGAGGGAIARRLARQLEWKLWDHQLTSEIAHLAQVDQAAVERLDERCDPLFYRLMKVFMRGSLEQSLDVEGLHHFDADSMVRFMRRVIASAAGEGNSVIVGRGAPFLLRGRDDAFHVFVYAPLDEKLRRLIADGKTESAALQELATVDRERSTFVRKYFDMEWPTRELYHLMINSKIGDDAVIQVVRNEIAQIETARLEQLVREKGS